MPQGIAITFPTNPTEGQSYLAQNGFTYIYSASKNQWKRGGEFVRAPRVLSYAGVAVTTTGSGITTGPLGGLVYRVPGVVLPNSTVGVDSYKAYRAANSYPDYTEVQVSISSAFSSVAYAATFTGTTHTIPPNTLSGNTTYYVRARQFVGSSAAAAGVGAISGYSQNIISFATTSVFLDTPTIVSIAATTQFPVYNIGFANTTLPATVTYFGSGVGNLQQVEWRVTGPRNPDSTGDVALAEVGIGTFSSATLANALVLAMPFSGATGVGITNDVNGAIRTASGASAGTTKTVTANGGIGTTSVGTAQTSHFYPSAAFFNGTSPYNITISGSATAFDFASNNFTVEYWYYVAGSGTHAFQTIVDFRSIDTTGNPVFGVTTAGQIKSYGFPSGTGDLTHGNIVTGWNHFAAVRNGSIHSIYQNGILVYSTTSTNAFGSNFSFRMGEANSGVTGGRYTYNGYIQDLKVYNGVAKYQENFTPPLPTYGTISYTTRTIGSVGVATTAFFESTGDIPTAEASSTAANGLVLAMPMNRTFGFQDINVAIRGLTSGASAGTAKTVGLGTTSTANAPSHPIISSTESKWYDGAAYFDGNDRVIINTSTDLDLSADYTIEGWFYWSSAGTQILLNTSSSGSVSAESSLVFISNVFCLSHNGSTIISTVDTIQTQKWYHFALTRNGSTTRMFLDGVLKQSSTTSYSLITGQNYYLGDRPPNAVNLNYPYNGYLQDLKIYKGFAKYTANFTPPQPICGFTTDLAIQTGFTTTTATGSLLSSVVGLGSTSTLVFAADQTYSGITSITSSSGITTLPDPYAFSLVLALPLANITGAGGVFTNDRNTQIRTASLIGGGTTKTITNSGVSTVSVSSATQRGYSSFSKFTRSSETFIEVTHTMSVPFTIEAYVYFDTFASGNAQCFMNTTPHTVIGISLNRTGNGDTYIYLGNGSGWLCTPCIISSSNLTVGKWWHIALVCDGTQTRLYHDGNLVGTTSTIPSGFGSTYRFGRNAASVGAEAFDGYMQDVRVYNFSKYTTNFTPPPPMFGDYTRSTPNKIVFTPGSDYVLEARNTATGGIVTSVYSATRQWGTKPKGGIYDPYGGNLVLAIPGGAVGGATTTFDVTGQIRYETPTATYVNAGIVTYSNSLGIGTYQNKTLTQNGVVSIATPISKYYGRSLLYSSSYLSSNSSIDFNFGVDDFTIECWVYLLGFGNNGYNHYFSVSTQNTFAFKSWSSTYYLYANSASAVETRTAPQLNQWNHLALVRRGTTLIIFVNGIVDGIKYNYTSSLGSTASATIGRASDTSAEGLNGYMNDLRVYKGVAKYTSNFTPPNQIWFS